MGVFLFSLAGVPPTGGFLGKYVIFQAAIESKQYLLAIVGVLNAAVAAYYYLRVLVVMYMKEPEEDSYDGREMVSVMMAGFLALLVITLGVIPDSFHRMALIVFRGIQF